MLFQGLVIKARAAFTGSYKDTSGALYHIINGPRNLYDNPTTNALCGVTSNPTASPTIPVPTADTVQPSTSPTRVPSDATGSPSAAPTSQTSNPTETPSQTPSTPPSRSPTAIPSTVTAVPTESPISLPTLNPTTTSSDPSKTPTEPPTSMVTVATNAPTGSPTASPTYQWEPCIEEFVLSTSSDTSDADHAMLSIDVSLADQNLRLRLSGPSDKWFGIGFGSSLMSNTYAITVSGNPALEIAQRILGNHAPGTAVSGVLDTEYEIDDGVTRNVSIVLDWNHVFDFTDFMECALEALPIIWAHGVVSTFGYHGVYKTDALQLTSCACVDEETTAAPNSASPTSAQPTAAPSPEVLEGDSAVSVHVSLSWALLFALVLSFIAGV